MEKKQLLRKICKEIIKITRTSRKTLEIIQRNGGASADQIANLRLIAKRFNSLARQAHAIPSDTCNDYYMALEGIGMSYQVVKDVNKKAKKLYNKKK